MKKSVSRHVALLFVVVELIFCVGMFLINNVYLERYYELRIERTLEKAYELVDSNISDDTGINEDFFENRFVRIERTNNLSMVILNKDFDIVFGSNAPGADVMAGRLYAYSMGFDTDDADVIRKTEAYTVQKRSDAMMGTEYLEIWGDLVSSDYHVIMRIPMESIRVNARISNEFLFYMLIIMLILTMIVIHYLSNRIAKPIRELTDLSQRMANLDFNAKYTSGGTDEIGQLGEHFNQMSETLEETISRLKTANNQLQQDLDEKAKIEQMRSEFLSNVSHELKTPIALIQGYAEGLKDCVNDDPEDRDYYCDVIIDESAKMNTLVRRLLTLNQIEFGDNEVEMKRFDLGNLIAGKIQSTQILASQKDAKIEYDGPSCIHAWGDEFKVEEVLTNYLSNAINHVESENRIVVRTRLVGPDGVEQEFPPEFGADGGGNAAGSAADSKDDKDVVMTAEWRPADEAGISTPIDGAYRAAAGAPGADDRPSGAADDAYRAAAGTSEEADAAPQTAAVASNAGVAVSGTAAGASNATDTMSDRSTAAAPVQPQSGMVVRTTVYNTGEHIPEEDLDKVWDKFFKVDRARTRAYGGSGVGLSIVKAIMDSFHQKCGVRNVVDGVEFWFDLESADGEQLSDEQSEEIRSERLAKESEDAREMEEQERASEN